ncbi:hypothetical protein Bhyg_07741, partial [Pseudolycoriella hygida]
MRLFFALMKNGRKPQSIHKVPFKAMLPMELRNHVSDHEFNDEHCAKEVAALREANREYLTTRRETKRIRNGGILTPGKDLHYKQLNNYLRLFPNPK